METCIKILSLTSDLKKLEEVYSCRDISTELGLTIGAAVGSKKLINIALKKKGGIMNMCSALEELEKECRIQGKIEGKIEGRIEGKIEGIVKTCKEFGAAEQTAAEKLQKECGLKETDAWKHVLKYYI